MATMTAEQAAAEILASAAEAGLHVAGVEPSDYQIIGGDLDLIAESGADEAEVRVAIRQLGLAVDEALDGHLAAIGADLDDGEARHASTGTLDWFMGDEAWDPPADCTATPQQFKAIARSLLALRIEEASAKRAMLAGAERVARCAEARGVDGATGAEAIEVLCRDAGATSEDSIDRSARRWTFPDGSGIVVQGRAWDVALAPDPDCLCWASAEEHHRDCPCAGGEG